MGKILGKADDYILRRNVLKDIEELDMIDTVDGLGRPVNKEDIRIQMFGTVYYVPKEDVIPIGWIEKKRDELDNNNGYASYIIDWLIEEWEEEQRIKNNGN